MSLKMDWILKIKYIFIELILSSVLGFSLSLSVVSSYGFEYNTAIIFLSVFTTNIILFFILYNKKTKIISLLIFFSILTELLLYAHSRNELPFHKNMIYSFFRWLSNTFKPENIFFNNAYINIIYILISIFIFLFAVKHFNLLVLAAFVTVIYAVQLNFKSFHSKTSFILSISIIILYYLRNIYKKYYKNKSDFKKTAVFSISVIPLTALIIFLAVQIPKPSVTLHRFFDNIFRQRYYHIIVPDNNIEYFSLEDTGFGSKGKLGGSVSPDDTLVLKVKSDNRIYLRGNALDVYDGSSWRNSSSAVISKKHNYTFLDYDFFNSSKSYDITEYNEAAFDLNMMYACNNFLNSGYKVINTNDKLKLINNSLEKDNYMLPENYFTDIYNEIEIEYIDIITKTVFHPLKTNKFIFSKYSKDINIHSGSVISTTRFLGKNSTYNLRYFSYNDDYLEMQLENTDYDFYENLYSYCSLSSNLEFSKTLYGENKNELYYFYSVSNLFYSKYLQLPEKLPERVKELAFDITKDHENLYDKVKAVEEYLSCNFSYTLNTNELPENKDFVDYFLFEEKKGYCTYYASAMVILLRCIGIPARYVEGFMLPDNKDTDGYYYVTNENAHAWPEVYLDGYGWVTFEPTTKFNGTFYDASGYNLLDYNNSFSEDPFWDDFLMWLEEDEKAGDPDYNNSTFNTVRKNNFSKSYIFIIFFLTALFIIFIVINRLKIKYKIYGKKSLKQNEKAVKLYEYIISLFTLLDYPPKSYETAVTYSERINKAVLFSDMDFVKITRKYLEAKYGKNKIPNEAIDLFYDYINMLNKKIIIIYGKPKYYFYKYILGKI